MLELLSLAQHRQRPLYFGKGALLAMSTSPFDQQAWLDRIGYTGSLQPTLDTLYKLIFAHSHGIAYEFSTSCWAERRSSTLPRCNER